MKNATKPRRDFLRVAASGAAGLVLGGYKAVFFHEGLMGAPV